MFMHKFNRNCPGLLEERGKSGTLPISFTTVLVLEVYSNRLYNFQADDWNKCSSMYLYLTSGGYMPSSGGELGNFGMT